MQFLTTKDLELLWISHLNFLNPVVLELDGATFIKILENIVWNPTEIVVANFEIFQIQ